MREKVRKRKIIIGKLICEYKKRTITDGMIVLFLFLNIYNLTKNYAIELTALATRETFLAALFL